MKHSSRILAALAIAAFFTMGTASADPRHNHGSRGGHGHSSQHRGHSHGHHYQPRVHSHGHHHHHAPRRVYIPAPVYRSTPYFHASPPGTRARYYSDGYYYQPAPVIVRPAPRPRIGIRFGF